MALTFSRLIFGFCSVKYVGRYELNLPVIPIENLIIIIFLIKSIYGPLAFKELSSNTDLVIFAVFNRSCKMSFEYGLLIIFFF